MLFSQIGDNNMSIFNLFQQKKKTFLNKIVHGEKCEGLLLADE